MVTQVIEVGRLRLLARKSRSTCWWTRRAVSTQDWANSQERRTIRHSVLTEDDLTHSPPAYELDFDHRSVDGQFREPSHRPRHSAQECKDQPSFTDGIRIGRRMQEEEDSLILSQYRSRLRSAQTKHREALVRLQVKYRSEVEILERELAGMRDRLMATQMAYEELAMTVDDTSDVLGTSSSESDAESSPSRSSLSCIASSSVEHVLSDDSGTSQNIPVPISNGPIEPILDILDVGQMASLLSASRETGDTAALKRVKSFLTQAERTPRTNRTPAQVYLITNWRSPKRPSRLSSPPPLLPLPFTVSPPSTAPSSSDSELILSDNSNTEIPHHDLQTNPNDLTEPILDIGQMSLLISAAHESGNTAAFKKRARALLAQAAQTARNNRTPAQTYLLKNWGSPAIKRSSRLSLPPPPLPLSLTSSLPDAPAPSSSSSCCLSLPEIFVDASAHGIGLVFNDHWLAWTFTPGHSGIPKGRNGEIDMSWAELVAVELGLRALLYNANVYNHTDTRVLVRSDNGGVVSALTKGTWCAAYGIGVILERVLRLCKDVGVEVTAKWVGTKDNPADGPSRGVYPPKERMLRWKPDMPADLRGTVSLVR